MKLLRRGTAMLLSIALVFTLVAVAASPNWSNAFSLGLLSRYYETGATNTDVEAAKMISTVDGDPGGKSYGAYMFASKSGTVKAFIEWCINENATNTVAYAIGEKLYRAYYSGGEGCGPLFDQAWLEAAVDYGSAFFTVQESYVKSDIYDEAIALIRETYPSFNINNYSVALKNVIWSRAVHHGPSGAASIVIRAFKSLDGFTNQAENDLIMAIYAESGRVVTAAELKRENGRTGTEVMNGSRAAKYDVDGKILRYWFGSSDGVQLSVYHRLNVNEPGDALSMLQKNAFVDATLNEGSYTISLKKDASPLALGVTGDAVKVVNTAGDNTGTAAKFTLHYLSGADAYTINTTVGDTTMRLAAGTAGSDGFGPVSLAKPSTSDTQLWYIDSNGNVKNKATGTYLSYRNDTLIMVGSEGTATNQTITAAASANDKTETFTQTLPEGSSDTAKTLSVKFVAGEYGTITENSTAVFETGTSSDFVAKKLHTVSPKSGWNFVGWFTENGTEVTAGSIGAAGELTLYAHYTASKVSPSAWTFSPAVSNASDFAVHHLFYPDEKTELHYNDSSFPVRGMIACSGTITKVAMTTYDEDGDKVSGASASVSPNASFYDLRALDSAIAYSNLAEGEYTFTLTATVNKQTITLAESSFEVGPAVTSSGSGETYLVTFDPGSNGTCSVKSKTYSLDNIVYGSLPEAKPNSGWGFAGWFTADGVEILPGTQIVAEDITLYAKYTKVYTYKFLNASSGTYQSGTAAAGTLFDAPTQAPVKSPDSQYTYKFSHWLDADNVKYYSGETIVMGEHNMTFTPVYTKSANTADGSGDGDGSSSAVWPVALGTTVSQLEGTVYSGNKEVTSGTLATGMTVKVDNKEYVISVTGDISGDGKITVTDVVRLQSHLLNKSSLSGAYWEAADLNSDNKVTITDLVKSARVVAGKDTIR